MVDISPYAMNYIASTIEPKRDLLNKINEEISQYLKKTAKIKDQYVDDLFGWSSYLEKECQELEENIRLEVREAWMMMGILNLARQLEDKVVNIILICNLEHFDGIMKLAEELGIKIERLIIKKIPNIDEKRTLKETIESSGKLMLDSNEIPRIPDDLDDDPAYAGGIKVVFPEEE